VPDSPLLRALLRSTKLLPPPVIDHALELLAAAPVRSGGLTVDLLVRPELSPAQACALYDTVKGRFVQEFRYWGRAEHSTAQLLAGVRVEDAEAVIDLPRRLSDLLSGLPAPERERRARELATSTEDDVLGALICCTELTHEARLLAVRQLNAVAGARELRPGGESALSHVLVRGLRGQLGWLWAHDPVLAAAVTTSVPKLPELLCEIVDDLPTQFPAAVLQAVVDALDALLRRTGFTIEPAQKLLFRAAGVFNARLTDDQRAQLHAAACTVSDDQVTGRPWGFPGMTQVFAPTADRAVTVPEVPVEVAEYVLEQAGPAVSWSTLLTLTAGFTGTAADLLLVTDSVTRENAHSPG
jgi:hypothetical protein